MSDLIVTTLESGVLTLAFNRPKTLNALNGELRDALRDAVAAAATDDDVRCLVIRGGKHFMAGGDIAEFSRRLDESPQTRQAYFETFIGEAHEIIEDIRRMPKPVLASASGAVAGFGLSLLLACDLAIAADDAIFTLAYINLGTSPDGGSTFALPRTVGTRKAAEIAFLGNRFTAEQSRDWGLVNWVVAADALDTETAAIAQKLAKGPTAALGRTKALLQQSLNATLEEQLQAEARNFAVSASERDFDEGVSAFMAKRKPDFRGA